MRNQKPVRLSSLCLMLVLCVNFAALPTLRAQSDVVGGASSDILGGSTVFVFAKARAQRVGQIKKRFAVNPARLCRAINCKRVLPPAPKIDFNRQAALFLRDGNAFAEKGEHDKAVAAYLKSIKAKPSAAGYYGLGESYAAQQKDDQAIANYEKAVAADPKLDVAYYDLGALQYKQKSFAPALANFDKAIALGAPVAPEYFYRGLILRELDRDDEAVAALQRAVEIDAKLIEAYENLGDLFYKQQNYQDANQFYRRLFELNPAAKKDADVLIRAGYANLLIKDSAQATELFALATKADPKSDQAWLALGSAYLLGAQPDVELAVKALTEAAALDAQNKDIQFALACALVNNQPLDAAALVRAATKAVELDPNNADAQMFLGVGLMNQRLYQPALQAFKKAASLDPKNSAHRSQICGAHAALKNYREALPECQVALERAAPAAKPGARLMLINVYTGLKRYKEAVAECETVIRENPAMPEAHFILGTIYATQKKAKEAIRAFQQAINLKPDFGLVHLVLGQYYWDLNKKDDALREFATLQSIDPRLAAELNLYITTHKK